MLVLTDMTNAAYNLLSLDIERYGYLIFEHIISSDLEIASVIELLFDFKYVMLFKKNKMLHENTFSTQRMFHP